MIPPKTKQLQVKTTGVPKGGIITTIGDPSSFFKQLSVTISIEIELSPLPNPILTEHPLIYFSMMVLL